MEDIGLAFRLLNELNSKDKFELGDDPWTWALCFQLYQVVQPNMMWAAMEPLLDIARNEHLSIPTRVAALACLSKIDSPEVIKKLALYVDSLKTFSIHPRFEMYNVIERKEVKLPPRYELLHKFEEDVTDVANWVERLEALNAFDHNPELTAFLIKQKKILAGQ